MWFRKRAEQVCPFSETPVLWEARYAVPKEERGAGLEPHVRLHTHQCGIFARSPDLVHRLIVGSVVQPTAQSYLFIEEITYFLSNSNL